LGTKGNTNKSKQVGNPERLPSTWEDNDEADDLTVDTWNTGVEVLGNPKQRTKEYGRKTGAQQNGTGSTHTGVKTHMDDNGKVHGHPFGNDRTTN
jgi:hypothetical protein